MSDPARFCFSNASNLIAAYFSIRGGLLRVLYYLPLYTIWRIIDHILPRFLRNASTTKTTAMKASNKIKVCDLVNSSQAGMNIKNTITNVIAKMAALLSVVNMLTYYQLLRVEANSPQRPLFYSVANRAWACPLRPKSRHRKQIYKMILTTQS